MHLRSKVETAETTTAQGVRVCSNERLHGGQQKKENVRQPRQTKEKKDR